MHRKLAAAVASAVLSALPAPAQVRRPAPPESYEVAVRYQTRTDQEGRLRDFRAFTDNLKSLGFVPADPDAADQDRFDITADRIAGTVPAANVRKLLADPFVRTVVLTPAGQAKPAGAATAEVRVELQASLGAEEQRQLHRQSAGQLARLGFREHGGYDHANYSVLRGSIPGGEVANLLGDLRTQPAGWFAPATAPDELPLPLRAVSPVRRVDVLPARPAVEAAAVVALPPAFTASAGKLSPDLAALAGSPDAANKPARIDLVLNAPPGPEWLDTRDRLRSAAPTASVEGVLGPVVTVRVARSSDIAAFANLPEVRAVRLAAVGATAGAAAAGAGGVAVDDWLKSSGVAALHANGFAGKGQTLAIVAPDFAGAAELFGKGLPAATRVIDLTSELDPDANPAPTPAGPSVGTHAALLASKAAPRADIVLVRVDAAAAVQLLTVAKAVTGDARASEAYSARAVDLALRRDRLAARRAAVSEAYAKARENLSDEGQARRDETARDFEKLLADESAQRGAVERLTAVRVGLEGLRGAAVVLNTLAWPAGQPQDGMSEVSRFLELNLAPIPARSGSHRSGAEPPQRPVWVQAASTATGRVWAGPLLDADDNGLVEFAPASAPLPPDQWTRELNFLRLNPPGAPGSADLPAGTKLRFTVQWREPLGVGVSTERPALAFAVRVLRQLDPTGKQFATDEFADVPARSGAPVRLVQTQGSAAYEQAVEVTLPAAGVYAVQLAGGPDAGALAPGLRQKFEVAPRVVVESDTAGKGEVGFATYAPASAGVGVPADSPAAFTVGAAPEPNQPALNLTGGGPGVVLRLKPDAVAPGRVTVNGHTLIGPAAAAALVAGASASLAGAGVRPADLARYGGDPRAPFAVPASLTRPRE